MYVYHLVYCYIFVYIYIFSFHVHSSNPAENPSIGISQNTPFPWTRLPPNFRTGSHDGRRRRRWRWRWGGRGQIILKKFYTTKFGSILLWKIRINLEVKASSSFLRKISSISLVTTIPNQTFHHQKCKVGKTNQTWRCGIVCQQKWTYFYEEWDIYII